MEFVKQRRAREKSTKFSFVDYRVREKYVTRLESVI